MSSFAALGAIFHEHNNKKVSPTKADSIPPSGTSFVGIFASLLGDGTNKTVPSTKLPSYPVAR
jgi:hypothetical protein